MSKYYMYHVTYCMDSNGPTQAVLIEATGTDQAMHILLKAKGKTRFPLSSIALAQPDDFKPGKPILRSEARKHELENEELADAFSKASETIDGLHSYEDLKGYVKEQIDSDNLYLAIHVLEALSEYAADFFYYDTTMGTLEEPEPICTIEDLDSITERFL